MIEMAEPLMELDAHDEKDSVATYDLAIIDNNTVDTDKVLRWGGTDSADGAITAITRAASGANFDHDLWLEDLSTADYQLMDENTGPKEISGSQCYHLFKLTSNATAYAAAPVITAYDDPADRATPDEEQLVGTTATSDTSFIKIVGGTTSAQPAQYWGEASVAALVLLEDALSVVLGVGAQGLNGDVAYMTCTAADINATPQYFSLAMVNPNDASLGTDVMQVVLSIKYQYT